MAKLLEKKHTTEMNDVQGTGEGTASGGTAEPLRVPFSLGWIELPLRHAHLWCEQLII